MNRTDEPDGGVYREKGEIDGGRMEKYMVGGWSEMFGGFSYFTFGVFYKLLTYFTLHT